MFHENELYDCKKEIMNSETAFLVHKVDQLIADYLVIRNAV